MSLHFYSERSELTQGVAKEKDREKGSEKPRFMPLEQVDIATSTWMRKHAIKPKRHLDSLDQAHYHMLFNLLDSDRSGTLESTTNTRTHTHIHAHTHIHVCGFAYFSTCVSFTSFLICVCVCVCVCVVCVVCVCVCVCMCVCMCVYVCISVVEVADALQFLGLQVAPPPLSSPFLPSPPLLSSYNFVSLLILKLLPY